MNGNGPCVLVIEDEPSAREVLCESLEAAGCRTIWASDGLEAQARLAGAQALPCVILLDLMMPGMNGWEFREWQRQEPRVSSVPVVVLSAIRDVADEARKLGVGDYLEKPLTFPKLLAMVEKHCGSCDAA